MILFITKQSINRYIIWVRINLSTKNDAQIGENSYDQLAGGIGIDWGKLTIDYAFLPSSINGIFANHHLISLSIYLDWLIEKMKEKNK